MGVQKITVRSQDDSYDLDTGDSIHSKEVLHKADEEGHKTPAPLAPWRRYIGLTICLVECLLFGGTIFGWYSLVYIFKQDGIYADLCEPTGGNSSTAAPITVTTSRVDAQQGDCAAQSDQLQLAFTISLATQGVSSLLLGIIFDKYGLLTTRSIGSVAAIIGYLLLAFTDIDRPWMIFPGSAFVMVSCVSIMLTNSHAASIAGSMTALVITVNNGAINTSGAVFFVIKLVHEAGIPRVYSLSFLCCLWSIVLISTIFILPHYKIPSFEDSSSSRTIDSGSDIKGVFVINGDGQVPSNRSAAEGTSSNRAAIDILEQEQMAEQMTSSYLQDGSTNSNWRRRSHERSHISQNKHLHLQVGGSKKMTQDIEKPLKKYIFASLNIIYLFWLTSLHVCIQFYLGSFNTRITDMLNGDIDQVSYFTNILAYAQMCGILIAPLSGALMVWRRRSMLKKNLTGQSRSIATILSILLTCAASIILAVTSLIGTSTLLYMSIFASELLRSTLYPTAIAFLEITWPGSAFGALFGIAFLIAGVGALIQLPYTIWLQRSGIFTVDMFLLGTCLSALILPVTIAVRYHIAKSKVAREVGVKT